MKGSWNFPVGFFYFSLTISSKYNYFKIKIKPPNKEAYEKKSTQHDCVVLQEKLLETCWAS
jgi:hypothetical protein